MFFFALGAIAAPYMASTLIQAYGPPAMFVMIAMAHVVLVAFGVIRMRARPTQTRPNRTRYVYTPRTSFVLGRLLGRQRERDRK
jgi:uncharacterized membrane protein YccC